MRYLALLVFAFIFCTFCVDAQLSFGGGGSDEQEEASTAPEIATKVEENDPVGTRGLVASVLGVDPLGQNGRTSSLSSSKSSDSCCCTISNFCPNPRDNKDDDDLGDFLKPRLKNNETESQEAIEDPRQASLEELLKGDIGLRIVNNPPNDEIQSTCPAGYRTCCFGSNVNTNSFGSNCIPASQLGNGGGNKNVFWQQGCQERIQNFGSSKQCGQRSFKPLFNLEKGQASPEEFPWSCLILTDKDKYLGGCAIVPERSDNDIRSGTYRVITAAHKLKLEANDGLKVRIIEYDARGFQDSERNIHQDIFVTRFIIHPNFNPKRLTDDIAVLILEKPIELQRQNGVNAVCYPACNNMFDYKFQNGTGVRCWVAGYGKDAENGKFSFIQRKVDVPIYDKNRCQTRLRQELAKAGSSAANRLVLSPGEICAGGETGKDSCDGDGGSPLVCQSKTGHWHVVGLVAWGVGCANPDTPGVYVNIYHYLDFITSASRNG